jgi:hypothetical protein
LDVVIFRQPLLEGIPMNDTLSVDIDAALQNPASVFNVPMDVVNHPALTVEAKMKLLEQWERDARALATARDEVIDGETNMLARVRRAMREMNDRSDPKARAATVVETTFAS